MAKPTQADQDHAEELLGEDGYQPTVWAIAQALADEREKGALQHAVPPSTASQRAQASAILDDLTFGGHSQDGAISLLARHLSTAGSEAVHDFLQWLRPNQLVILRDTEGMTGQPLDQVLESWKADRARG